MVGSLSDIGVQTHNLLAGIQSTRKPLEGLSRDGVAQGARALASRAPASDSLRLDTLYARLR